MSTGFSSLVRAEGRMRFSTLLWLVPVLVQITLDPLLIFGLHLGVRGAALGTIGGQSVSAAMSVWFFFLQPHRPYRIGRADLRPHAATVRALLDVGAPSFLSGFGATLLAVLVNTTLAHQAGTTALAAYAVCARIQTFVSMPHLGISQGMQPVVGYNAGQHRPGRVRRTRILALRATLTYGVLVLVAVTVFTRPLVALFVDDQDIAATARHALRIIAIGLRHRRCRARGLGLFPVPRPATTVLPDLDRHTSRDQGAPRDHARSDQHHRGVDQPVRR